MTESVYIFVVMHTETLYISKKRYW